MLNTKLILIVLITLCHQRQYAKIPLSPLSLEPVISTYFNKYCGNASMSLDNRFVLLHVGFASASFRYLSAELPTVRISQPLLPSFQHAQTHTCILNFLKFCFLCFPYVTFCFL